MTPLSLMQRLLRPVGLVLFFVSYLLGYLWGHLSGGFYDGVIEAHKETE